MTTPFTTLSAIAAPLPLLNVDTDKIIAARFLKVISRKGLGDKLFADMRYVDDIEERPDFILNRVPWREAGILIALDNFGCGSSREHAPWALADFGIRAILAPSFADIFYNNCFKNGILPIQLSGAEISALLAEAANPETAVMHIDLAAQTIDHGNGETIRFDVPRDRQQALLNGLDEIGATLAKLDRIESWERASTLVAPPIPTDAWS